MEDTEEKRITANNLAAKYAQGASFEPVTEKELERTAIVEITVAEMTGKANERKADS